MKSFVTMNLVVKSSLPFLLYLVIMHAPSDHKCINVEFEYRGFGSNWVGVRLEKDTLHLAKYTYKDCFFCDKYQMLYDHIKIPRKELNPIAIYRLSMFLNIHEYFSKVKLYRGEEPCGRLEVYRISNGVYQETLYNDEYCYDHCYDKDRFLLEELKILLNEIIPEGCERFYLYVNHKKCK
jgi:hypothetical protein